MLKKPNYRQSIVGVSKSILKFYQIGKQRHTIKKLDHLLSKDINHVVLMLLDGMGVNILNAHINPDAFLRKHHIQTISTVFPPTTVAATNALLSAKNPIESGYLGWTQYFKDYDQNLVVFLNEDDKTGLKINQDISSTLLKYDSILDQIAIEHPEIKVSSLFPAFKVGGSKTFDEHLYKLEKIINQNEQSMTYVYWTEPDHSMHELGILDDKIYAILNILNAQIESFANKMKPDTVLIVIADHGMTNVKSLPLHKNEDLLQMLLRRPSIEPRATNFFIKPGLKLAFKRQFLQDYGAYFHLLSKQEVYKTKLFGPGKKHPQMDDFLGDFLAVAKADYMFQTKEETPFKAHHAGLTKIELEVPLIVYKKPY
jgi:predicted AlkP superfamily pyrophosphatase or phosphodiesterase